MGTSERKTHSFHHVTDIHHTESDLRTVCTALNWANFRGSTGSTAASRAPGVKAILKMSFQASSQTKGRVSTLLGQTVETVLTGPWLGPAFSKGKRPAQYTSKLPNQRPTTMDTTVDMNRAAERRRLQNPRVDSKGTMYCHIQYRLSR
ncbi:hypothetical protein RRG08_066764 [Elysia crispata]|uniref:Uncharacterized protein n=1 Tax=Elysia crispata TaxID=231223 RepID=A0AAE1CJP3_9GAST|nr:hypothetical protein RRG08_066764 [Elysia crispata]